MVVPSRVATKPTPSVKCSSWPLAAQAAPGLDGLAAVAERFGAALTGSSVLLTIALLVVLVSIVPTGRSRRAPTASAVEDAVRR
jgi:hypothetical protein